MAGEPGATAKPGRMKMFARSALAIVLVCAAAGPALADDKTDLQIKISAALKAAKSFSTTAIVAANGLVINSVLVAPDRAKTTVAAGGMTMDSVLIGSDLYVSRNSAPFEKSAAPPAVAAQLKLATEPVVAAIVSDVTESGVTYGAFTMPFTGSTLPMTLTCEYDKATFRLAKCANEKVSVTYSNDDDPKNVVEIPKDAK